MLALCRVRRYLTDVANVDIYWYVGSRLNTAPNPLPRLKEPIRGSSIVPWRYHFNTGKLENFHSSPFSLVSKTFSL